MKICRSHGIAPPQPLQRYIDALDRHLASPSPAPARRTAEAQLPQPIPPGAIARLTDDGWWRRKLRVVHARTLEAEAIRLHLVHSGAGRYISDATLHRCRQQKRRNARILAGLVAINEVGEEIALEEVAQHSLANPRNRRCELMTRIRGFDELSVERKDCALMVTITCPSRMHSHHSDDGRPNPRFDPDTTPKVAQSYLTHLWKLIRAKWTRLNIRPYGFRITEAHHDGTPHWHILIFVANRQRKAAITTMREYALADSPNEPGAAKHRFQVERIDLPPVAVPAIRQEARLRG